jgi:hypothetical protein
VKRQKIADERGKVRIDERMGKGDHKGHEM